MRQIGVVGFGLERTGDQFLQKARRGADERVDRIPRNRRETNEARGCGNAALTYRLGVRGALSRLRECALRSIGFERNDEPNIRALSRGRVDS